MVLLPPYFSKHLMITFCYPHLEFITIIVYIYDIHPLWPVHFSDKAWIIHYFYHKHQIIALIFVHNWYCFFQL